MPYNFETPDGRTITIDAASQKQAQDIFNSRFGSEKPKQKFKGSLYDTARQTILDPALEAIGFEPVDVYYKLGIMGDKDIQSPTTRQRLGLPLTPEQQASLETTPEEVATPYSFLEDLERQKVSEAEDRLIESYKNDEQDAISKVEKLYFSGRASPKITEAYINENPLEAVIKGSYDISPLLGDVTKGLIKGPGTLATVLRSAGEDVVTALATAPNAFANLVGLQTDQDYTAAVNEQRDNIANFNKQVFGRADATEELRNMGFNPDVLSTFVQYASPYVALQALKLPLVGKTTFEITGQLPTLGRYASNAAAFGLTDFLVTPGDELASFQEMFFDGNEDNYAERRREIGLEGGLVFYPLAGVLSNTASYLGRGGIDAAGSAYEMFGILPKGSVQAWRTSTAEKKAINDLMAKLKQAGDNPTEIKKVLLDYKPKFDEFGIDTNTLLLTGNANLGRLASDLGILDDLQKVTQASQEQIRNKFIELIGSDKRLITNPNVFKRYLNYKLKFGEDIADIEDAIRLYQKDIGDIGAETLNFVNTINAKYTPSNLTKQTALIDLDSEIKNLMDNMNFTKNTLYRIAADETRDIGLDKKPFRSLIFGIEGLIKQRGILSDDVVKNLEKLGIKASNYEENLPSLLQDFQKNRSIQDIKNLSGYRIVQLEQELAKLKKQGKNTTKIEKAIAQEELKLLNFNEVQAVSRNLTQDITAAYRDGDIKLAQTLQGVKSFLDDSVNLLYKKNPNIDSVKNARDFYTTSYKPLLTGTVRTYRKGIHMEDLGYDTSRQNAVNRPSIFVSVPNPNLSKLKDLKNLVDAAAEVQARYNNDPVFKDAWKNFDPKRIDDSLFYYTNDYLVSKLSNFLKSSKDPAALAKTYLTNFQKEYNKLTPLFETFPNVQKKLDEIYKPLVEKGQYTDELIKIIQPKFFKMRNFESLRPELQNQLRDDPVVAINKIFNSDNPAEAMKRTIQALQEVNPRLVDAFKYQVNEYISDNTLRSVNNQELPAAREMINRYYGTSAEAKKNYRALSELFEKGDLQNQKKLLELLVKTEETLPISREFEISISDTPIMDRLMRPLGALAFLKGSPVKAEGGAQFAVAAANRKAGEEVFSKFISDPNNSMRAEIYKKFLQNPEYAANILSTNPNVTQAFILNEIIPALYQADLPGLKQNYEEVVAEITGREAVDDEVLKVLNQLRAGAPAAAPITPEPAPPVTPPVTAAPQPSPFAIQPPAQGSSLSGIDIGQILREEEQRKLLGLER
jgi:hypothetical protein